MVLLLWRGGHCSEIKMTVNVWTVCWARKKGPLRFNCTSNLFEWKYLSLFTDNFRDSYLQFYCFNPHLYSFDPFFWLFHEKHIPPIMVVVVHANVTPSVCKEHWLGTNYKLRIMLFTIKIIRVMCENMGNPRKVCKRGRFSVKMVYKRVRGRTSGQSLAV